MPSTRPPRVARPPQSRSELIALIQRQAPSSVIRRACLTGRVEVFGGFHHIHGSPGWIVRLLSANCKEYIIAVVCNDFQHCFDVERIDLVPWSEWAGGDGKSELTNGDHPLKYAETWYEATQTS